MQGEGQVEKLREGDFGQRVGFFLRVRGHGACEVFPFVAKRAGGARIFRRFPLHARISFEPWGNQGGEDGLRAFVGDECAPMDGYIDPFFAFAQF